MYQGVKERSRVWRLGEKRTDFVRVCVEGEGEIGLLSTHVFVFVFGLVLNGG